MIPLTIIDNAVKYSPHKSQIEITIIDSNQETTVEVTSLGPKIEKDELMLIFNKNYRGRQAQKSGQRGSGIGLYFARQLAIKIKGDIFAEQEDDPNLIQQKNYYKTKFTVKFEALPNKLQKLQN